MEPYKVAQKRLLSALKARGWTTKPDLSVPQAMSPSMEIHIYFRRQAVYYATGYSAWIDIRGEAADSFIRHLTMGGMLRERY